MLTSSITACIMCPLSFSLFLSHTRIPSLRQKHLPGGINIVPSLSHTPSPSLSRQRDLSGEPVSGAVGGARDSIHYVVSFSHTLSISRKHTHTHTHTNTFSPCYPVTLSLSLRLPRAGRYSRWTHQWCSGTSTPRRCAPASSRSFSYKFLKLRLITLSSKERTTQKVVGLLPESQSPMRKPRPARLMCSEFAYFEDMWVGLLTVPTPLPG